MIKLQVIGHIGSDATTNSINGNSVINFSVAHSEKWRDAQGQQKEKTIWVSCAYWTDKTGILPYLKKSQLVYVEGTPEVSIYTNARGESVPQLKVRVLSVQLLGGSKKEDQDEPIQRNVASDIPQQQSGDLPF